MFSSIRPVIKSENKSCEEQTQRILELEKQVEKLEFLYNGLQRQYTALNVAYNKKQGLATGEKHAAKAPSTPSQKRKKTRDKTPANTVVYDSGDDYVPPDQDEDDEEDDEYESDDQQVLQSKKSRKRQRKQNGRNQSSVNVRRRRNAIDLGRVNRVFKSKTYGDKGSLPGFVVADGVDDPVSESEQEDDIADFLAWQRHTGESPNAETEEAPASSKHRKAKQVPTAKRSADRGHCQANVYSETEDEDHHTDDDMEIDDE